MTKANILITGASGYLGGTLLARWQSAQISGYEKLYALIRKPEQAETVKKLYGAEPVQVAGNSWYEPDHAKAIGWKPEFGPEHILDVVDDEVSLILGNLTDSPRGHR
ncbi:elongation factor 2 [Fusarium mexicanum]|uniref:Elongation factor 2 n=1 Tax=Fusarium mexicanum TaxID=751941 RepID=A0A8H5JHF2_9HYPO|nr:elongation factor 2 [Fusarium mexicanum]